MTIDYVALSLDDNPCYSGFFELVKRAWVEIFNIKPILIKITDKDCITEYSDYICHEIKQIKNIPPSVQAKISRYYIYKYYKDSNIIISDIDMIPVKRDFFLKPIEGLNDDVLVLYNADAYGHGKPERYPLCYVLANGNTMCEILNLNQSFEMFIRNITNEWKDDLTNADELFLGKKIIEYEKKHENLNNFNKILRIDRGWREGPATNRIDRVQWAWTVDKFKDNTYIDIHCLHCYDEHKYELKEMLDLAIKYNKI